tara:strand:+ start:491 stop:1453 length:963 start_codon:yes stop_codon:yes gene_type:complete
MSSINGLKRISATSIDNTGVIRLGNQLNPGVTGQVIKSNGGDAPAAWANETPHTNERLTMGTNLSLQSGNTFYDGSVAETIEAATHTNQPLTVGSNIVFLSGAGFYDGTIAETIIAQNTKTPLPLTINVGLVFSNNPFVSNWDGLVNETLISYGADYYKDNVTGYIYKQIKPSNFVMDDDSGGDNRWVISDGVNTEGQAVNRGANATQIYAYFDIPSGYKFTGYRINLNDSAGNPWTTPHSNTFYTRAGIMENTGTRTWANNLGGQGYNAHIPLTTQYNNNWGAAWVKGSTMNYGLLMCYRLYWSSSYFFPGGYVEFQQI